MTTSQLEKVRTYLKAGRTLTSAEARSRFGIKNLSARIFDLRRDGLTINTTPYRPNLSSAHGAVGLLPKRLNMFV